ncbi:GNAT family N-acetyltransferase [Psychroserpens ponticola]|uniref:GNAT family N-acetyltransferase n=1 Tax=Psychroserpens ponticola TaxID=2932268 RepID=A0ABY7RXN1_9FLAO|nr:GNAT family N-acetyltransferase [Psychroserpens ponticola]WCO01901.1 GNAT family N-acetyltransferase [Psychroserpens ponticola]
MDLNIRDAVKGDMPRVHELITELAVFEKEPDAVKITAEDLEVFGFGIDPKFHCFVAEVNNEIEGIALVYSRFSTWSGVVLHLEDLIVSQNKRGLGLGTKLLDTVVKYAEDLGVKRVSWEVIDWNEPAIAFYEKKGANVMRDWDVVQLDEEGIKNYLSKI